MSTTATHLLKKLDKLKERTAMHRAGRKKDILLGDKSLFSEATNKRKFTVEEIENFRFNYKTKLHKRRKKNRWIICLIVVISLPATLSLLNIIFMYGINS